jgi:hypothetical protein
MGEFRLFIQCDVWSINAERKLNHMARASKVKPVRHAAQLRTLNAMRQNGLRQYKVPVHVEFFPVQGKRGPLADTANHLPACKAVLDGIVDAGLLKDDTPAFVQSQRFWSPTKDSDTGIGVVITPVSNS